MAYALRRRRDGREETIEVPGTALLIGRGPDAHLRLEDAGVELGHARIDSEEGDYVLRDLGGLAGTYVNGRRIQEAKLAAGDRVTIGRFLIEVVSSAPEGTLTLETRLAGGSGEPIRLEHVDYARAYALSSGVLGKGGASLILSLGALVVLGGVVAAGRTSLFRPGGVSEAHALFSSACSRCHVPWYGPSAKACEECHSGPVHHKEQISTPSCLSCHREHLGRPHLARVPDRDCLQCHGQLKTKGDQPLRFAKTVTDFFRGHPEFAVGAGEGRIRLSQRGAYRSDHAKIKLNHQVHLKSDLKGPSGPVQLTCESCHTVGPDGRLMAPIHYKAHCQDCHSLGFDDQIPAREVPHAEPEIVHAYLIRVYAELQGEIVPYLPGRKLPGVAETSRLSPSIFARVRSAERHLFGVTCKECHAWQKSDDPLPVLEKPAIPVVWLPHARFSHKPHRLLQCAQCHIEAPRSKVTEDVLIPGIRTCRQCHLKSQAGMEPVTASAPADCVTCHVYHDKSADTRWNGRFTLQGLLRGEKKAGTPGE